tara:strand:+ start:4408 stop:6645 length:2238 start_codon:yes stop_codon:yes gene_type:complete
MNNIVTDYVTFDVLDYKNESPITNRGDILSTYNLPITPLLFKAKIPRSSDVEAVGLDLSKVQFDFGDGTIANGASASHIYQYPGQYTVKMVLRDIHNNAVLGSLSGGIKVLDYIEDSFDIKFDDPTTGADGGGYDGVGHLSNLNLSAGEFSDPLSATSQVPFYLNIEDIYFSLSGDKYDNYFNLEKNKFNHFKTYSSFYTKNTLSNLSAVEYNEIKTISLTGEFIYVKLSSYGTDLSAVKIVTSNRNDDSSIIAGTSGQNIVYFKTEEQSNPIYLSFFKNPDVIHSTSVKKTNNTDYPTNFNITLSTFVGSTSAQTLSNIQITSNGLGGDKDEFNSFPINSVQFKGVGIPLVLNPKNTNNYTVKALSASYPFFKVLSGSDTFTHPLCVVADHNYTITSINQPVSTFNTDFAGRFLLTFNDNVSSTATVIRLSASNDYAFASTITNLTGSTPPLTCFPKDFYAMSKHNEDFGFEEMYDDLRFQEALSDKDEFFTDLLGTIVGNVSSSHNTLGKKIWEKCFNFVPNNNDIDDCSIDSLINLANMVDADALVFDGSNNLTPPEIERVISILSANYNRLRGTENTFSENFANMGQITKDTYGKNLSSDKLDTYTYVVTAGTDIVAYEKFSGLYTKLNTYQPLCSVELRDGSTNQYAFSGIGSESPQGSAWGWPLTLPVIYDIGTVNDNYNFYPYSSVYEGTIVGGIIDFTNPLTTLSFNEPLSTMRGNEKIDDIMIRNTLYSSLSLFPA